MNCRFSKPWSRRSAAGCLLGLFLGGAGWLVAAPTPASAPAPGVPDFELREFGGPGTRRLSDFAGRIVVLDFFAYWCVPCLPASRELDAGIRRHFAARGGNAQGIPVEVIPVNVEGAHPELTREFISRAGIDRAFHDPEGKVLESLQGEALPFIVILDGQRASTQQGAWRLVHRQSGLKGTSQLRALIDSIGKGEVQSEITNSRAHRSTASVQPGQPSRQSELSGPSWWSAWSAEAGAELLGTEDILLSSFKVSARHARPRWDAQLSATRQGFDLKYEPDIVIPGLFFAKDLSERQWAGQLATKGTLVDGWKWLANGGYYDGFADYKSIWLEEFYRQSFSQLKGYEETEPWGFNLGGGLRWDYIPAAAFVQAELAYQKDEISPSYEKPLFAPLVRGLDRIETRSARLAAENVLSRRLRVRHELQVVDATERDLRYSIQSQANYAAGEHWTLKAAAGGTWEPPEFSAYFVDTSAEFGWSEHWSVRTFVHYYTDDGLIRDPLIISSAQPALDAFLVGLGLRYVHARIAVDLAAGPYFTRYDDLPSNAGDFEGLYRDRDWWSVKLGVAYRF